MYLEEKIKNNNTTLKSSVMLSVSCLKPQKTNLKGCNFNNVQY